LGVAAPERQRSGYGGPRGFALDLGKDSAWCRHSVATDHLDHRWQEGGAMKEVQVDMFGQRLAGVEVFRPGKWNGDKYTISDLDEIISSFDKGLFNVPVKLGHSEEPGEPAYGWVESLRRVGDRLVADLSDLPDTIYQAIVDRRFDAVSSEIFLNLERDGEKLPLALKAVALLGAEIPAVAGLKPLRDSLRGFSEAELADVRTYSFNNEEPDMAETKKEVEETNDEAMVELKAFADAQAAKVLELETKLAEKDGGSVLEIKKLTAEIADLRKESAAAKAKAVAVEIDAKVEAIKLPSLRDHARALYSAAYAMPMTVSFSCKDSEGETKTADTSVVEVIDSMYEFFNSHSEKLFKEIGINELRRDEEPRKEDAGEEVDRLVKLALAKDKSLTYSVAMKAVLSDPANAELKRAFAR
jgi:hypothetical protein